MTSPTSFSSLPTGRVAFAVATLGAALAFLSAVAVAQAPAASSNVTVTVDSLRKRVIILAGPFDLASAEPMPYMADDDHMDMPETGLLRFTWPVDGWLHGGDLTLVNARGDTLPRRILHHMQVYNLDQRSLVYSMVERVFAWAQDTRTIALPAGVASPLQRGDRLAYRIAWYNDTGEDVHGVYVRMVFPYLPPSQVKVTVLPWNAYARNRPDSITAFDLPVGRSTQRGSFTVPVDGRLILVGGHMHNYGRSVRLVDSVSGKTLVKLNAERDAKGHVTGTGRFIFGFHDEGLRLYAHHTYTVVSEYDNTSGKPIKDGGMGVLGGAFQPDDLSQLPKMDYADPYMVADLKAVQEEPARDSVAARPPR